MSNRTKKALIIAPHQDDEAIGCGGTIVYLKEKGFEIAVIHIFKGTSGVKRTVSAKASKIRQDEALKGAKLLGYKLLPNLSFIDRASVNPSEIQNKLIKIFRSYKPNLILAPHEEEQDKEHKLVAKAVWEAGWLSSTPNFKRLGKPTDSLVAILGYEVWTPIKKPIFYIDITNFKSAKEKLLSSFKSQIELTTWRAGSIGLNIYRGTTLQGRGLAEAFTLKMTNMNKFIDLFTNK